MMNKVYFKNLNGLRFFAAGMVIVSHIEQIKDLRGMKSLYKNPLFSSLGTLGVVMFFVLSGFLITYLLMFEKESSEKQQVSIRNFFIRRILRIWPLYFIVVFIGLLLMPLLGFYEFSPGELQQAYDLKRIIPLFIFFLPNVILVLFGGLPFLHQTWSIGTEEQFYLAWPFVIQNTKNILRTLTVIVSIYLAVKLGLYLFKAKPVIHDVYSIWASLSVVSLSVGAFCAYIYHRHKERFIKVSSNKLLQVCILVSFVVLIYFVNKIPSVIRYDVFSLFFGFLILKLIVSERLNFLEFKPFNYLGKISYGLYMWHPIAITIALSIPFAWKENNIYIYVSSFVMTILIAGLSYGLIEKRFLTLKKKYSKIVQD